MKQIVWEWEKISEQVSRVKVIGGWLVHHRTITNKSNTSECMVFIQDQHWEWAICAPFVDPQIKKAEIARDFKA